MSQEEQGTARVLIADDHPEARKTLRQMLQVARLAVDEASTGLEAMAATRRRYYEVVLLDIDMPGADGLEVLQWLRPPERARAVVMITGLPVSTLGFEARELGACACLQKPVGLQELLQKVEEAVGREVAGESRDPVVRAIQRSFFRVVGREDIARETGLSLRSVTARVKQETGLTVPQLLRQLRVASAKRALETTEMTVGEIAADVGYRHAEELARAFREEVGMTPTAYRAASESGAGG